MNENSFGLNENMSKAFQHHKLFLWALRWQWSKEGEGGPNSPREFPPVIAPQARSAGPHSTVSAAGALRRHPQCC